MKVAVVVALAICLTRGAFAEQLQIGTKTCPATFVAYVAGASPLPNAQADVETAFHTLWTACQEADLHPLCVPGIQTDISGIDTGTLKWEVQFPLADKLDPQSLPNKPPLCVKQLPETKVAFSYVTGDPWKAMETAFGDLHKWAVDQGLPVTTIARGTVYVGLFAQDVEDMVTECQLELR